MRVEYIPTIRGDMEFVAVTAAQSPTVGGTTYSANATGTTWSTGTSHTYTTVSGASTSPTSTITNSFSSSITAVQTMASYQTAAATSTHYGTTTTTAEATRTLWTTSSLSTTDTNEQSFTFVVSAESIEQTVATSSFQRTDTAVSTTATVTVTANCVDTVYIAEDNEWLMALTAPMFASTWDGNLLEADAYVERGSRITISADVQAVSVKTANSDVLQSTITVPSSTQVVSYDALSDTGVQTQTSVDFLAFPNQTSTYESPTFSRFEIDETAETFTTDSELILHYGNTEQRKVWVTKATSESYWTPEDYRTYRAYAVTHVTTMQTATTPSYWVDAGTANGNTTRINPEQKLGLSFKVGAGDPVRCVVSKEYGVRLGAESGLFYTLDDSVTVGSSGIYAAIERANSYLSHQLVTLMTTSNEDYTLSGGSFTWTTTSEQDGDTVATTSSQSVQVEGEPQTGIVTVKSVVGGSPEGVATFWDFIEAGAYYDQSGQFTTFPNSSRSYASGQSYPTSVLAPAWHIRVDGSGDLVTVERNPYPPPYDQF